MLKNIERLDLGINKHSHLLNLTIQSVKVKDEAKRYL